MILNSYAIMILFSVAALALFLLFFFTTGAYLVGHSKRENITFKTFSSKIKFFNVQMNPIIQGFFMLVLFGLVILILYTAFTFNAELRVYAIPFVIVFILILSLYFIYPILGQLDEDMIEYVHNYQLVNEALRKKLEAEKSIEKTLLYKTNIISLINDFERQIRLVDDPEKFHLKDSIAIIDQFAASQTKTINDYQEEVLLRFDKALEQYFEHKIQVELKLPNTDLNFESAYDNVRSEVFDKYHKIFNNTLFVLIESRKYNTSTIITSGLQILKNNNYSPTQELIELILISIDNIEGSPRELIDYLVSRKIVELEDIVSYAINQKILWVFKSNLFESQDQLATVSERLVKEDAYTQSVAFISNYFTRLGTVLAFLDKTKEKNRTLDLFHNYKKVMNVDATFYNESKVYENKLLSLKVFFEGRSKSEALKRKLQEVSKLRQIYSNKDKINDLYINVLDKFEDLRLNSTQSLLLYSGVSDTDGLFDLKKTSKMFSDFYNRLLMKDLVYASLLLYSIFLYSNESEELYNEVINAFNTTKEYKAQLQLIDLETPFENHKALSKQIIQKILLADEEKGRMANIIVNVENERLTLRKLASIR